MATGIDLPKLRATDIIGRRVYSRKRAARAQRGTVVHDIFLERPGVGKLSVDRLDHASNREMTEIAETHSRVRSGPFTGWATVTIEDASKNGRNVLASPQLANPYHADICLNLPDNNEQRDIQIEHAHQLAAAATWRNRCP